MDSRISALADQLLLVERELRVMGLWATEPPPAEAMASQQPFCVDTMDLEAWLQWIFLPRMKQLLQSGGALPTSSGIRAMAEERFSGAAKGLLAALGEFDRLIDEAG